MLVVSFVKFVLVAVAVLIGAILITDQFSVLRGLLPIQHVLFKYGFTDKDVPDLTGKTAIVTGANSGVGYGTTLVFALHGCDVIMACRSVAKCEEAKTRVVDEIRHRNPKARVPKLECAKLDLASLADVKRFATEYIASGRALHALVNNGGVMYPPYELTPDGFEMAWGTNHMGHFYLTHLLYPALKKSAPATVVSVSSNGHFLAGPQDDIRTFNDKATFDIVTQYGRSKLANLLLARELARRIPTQDQVYINALNPGGVQGNLYRHLPDWMQVIVKAMFPLVWWSEEVSGWTIAGMAFAPEIFSKKITGKYYVPVFRADEGSAQSRNASLAKLWYDVSADTLKSKGFVVPPVA